MYRFLIVGLILSLMTGYCTGNTIAEWTGGSSPSFRVITYSGAVNVPVVTINGIRNGKLEGALSGNIRLFAGSHLVLPDGSGSFSIGDSKILTNRIEIHIPDGMRFVASKKGKKYYPVESASAGNLSPANRVYFPSAEAAERAGFKR